MLYLVQATVTRTDDDGWSTTTQVPAFILDSAVQGIVNEGHAEVIALDVVNPFRDIRVKASFSICRLMDQA